MNGWTIAGIICLIVGIIMAVAGFIFYGNYSSKREPIPWWIYLLIGLGFVVILVSLILFAVPYLMEPEEGFSVEGSITGRGLIRKINKLEKRLISKEKASRVGRASKVGKGRLPELESGEFPNAPRGYPGCGNPCGGYSRYSNINPSPEF
jgi:hypothetical protein